MTDTKPYKNDRPFLDKVQHCELNIAPSNVIGRAPVIT